MLDYHQGLSSRINYRLPPNDPKKGKKQKQKWIRNHTKEENVIISKRKKERKKNNGPVIIIGDSRWTKGLTKLQFGKG